MASMDEVIMLEERFKEVVAFFDEDIDQTYAT